MLRRVNGFNIKDWYQTPCSKCGIVSKCSPYCLHDEAVHKDLLLCAKCASFLSAEMNNLLSSPVVDFYKE